MSMPGMMTEELSMPGITDKLGGNAQKYLQGYSVKYGKFDLDDLGDLTSLSDIETRAIRGDDIVLLTKDKMGFMTQYFVIISYLEKND